MGEILAFKRKKGDERSKGSTLCRNGHHKWMLDKDSRFDVKSGKLVTVYRCTRCGIVEAKPA